MLNNFCFDVFAQKWVFVIMSHVTCHMSHVTCDMSYVKCLCWSLGHAEQLLFSGLWSNVAVYWWKWQWFFLQQQPPPPLWLDQSEQRFIFLAGNQLYDWYTNRMGCGCGKKKHIEIFTNKQQHLTIDMKTKLAHAKACGPLFCLYQNILCCACVSRMDNQYQ